MIPVYATYSGFHPSNTLFQSQHNNFGGNAMNIVMPNESMASSNVWTYPDNSTVRSGPDFSTAQYLSEALNFKLKSVYKSCLALFYIKDFNFNAVSWTL